MLLCTQTVEDIKTASAGDIVALAGLKYTITGHTLCDSKSNSSGTYGIS